MRPSPCLGAQRPPLATKLHRPIRQPLTAQMYRPPFCIPINVEGHSTQQLHNSFYYPDSWEARPGCACRKCRKHREKSSAQELVTSLNPSALARALQPPPGGPCCPTSVSCPRVGYDKLVRTGSKTREMAWAQPKVSRRARLSWALNFRKNGPRAACFEKPSPRSGRPVLFRDARSGGEAGSSWETGRKLAELAEEFRV